MNQYESIVHGVVMLDIPFALKYINWCISYSSHRSTTNSFPLSDFPPVPVDHVVKKHRK
jgi:hypothetical protein